MSAPLAGVIEPLGWADFVNTHGEVMRSRLRVFDGFVKIDPPHPDDIKTEPHRIWMTELGIDEGYHAPDLDDAKRAAVRMVRARLEWMIGALPEDK